MVTQEEKVHAKVREHDYLCGTPYWESVLKDHNVTKSARVVKEDDREQ